MKWNNLSKYHLILMVIVNVKPSVNDNVRCEDNNIKKLCLDQESCDACLQIDPCCNWCYEKSYTGRRCNTITNLSACNPNQTEINSDGSIDIPVGSDKNFTSDIENLETFENIIQMKPQSAQINLRKGVPVNFTFIFKPVENYPLELYFLADLSLSMQANLNVMKTIGKDLPKSLTQLTKNYRLAYGSFMDKTGMPFYFTDPMNFANPCGNLLTNCEQGYLFKHKLNFTSNTDIFDEKIQQSKITANVDDLDGALDAILQILACKKQMGWTERSRKIIFLPTDSLLHTAGDGLLVGAVKKPTDLCLLDMNGDHVDPMKYDYPSVGQIHELLKEKKVNIIFAVKDKDKQDYYRNIARQLLKDSSFVGELEANSTNILDLITKGYYNFARQVNFYINTTLAKHVGVTFFADCNNSGRMIETSTCYGVYNKSVNFKVQLTLNELPADERLHDILYIEEKNINDLITLNVTYLGMCKCKNYDGSTETCENGKSKCGDCICGEGWTGKSCNVTCDEYVNYNLCRSFEGGIASYVCNKNGNCICGKCICNFPYEGKFCQHKCPTSNQQKCGGPSQGTCSSEGKCSCKNGFTGEDCSCSLSTDRCKILSDICSGNGDCECDQCICREGFSGQFCEINTMNSSNSLCRDYSGFVEEAVTNFTDINDVKFNQSDNSVVIVTEHSDNLNRSDVPCLMVVFVNTVRCEVEFWYYAEQKNTTRLVVEKTCLLSARYTIWSLVISIILAILVGGLLFIAAYKYKIYKEDKEEYETFLKNEKSSRMVQLNPIYLDPVSRYVNVARLSDQPRVLPKRKS